MPGRRRCGGAGVGLDAETQVSQMMSTELQEKPEVNLEGKHPAPHQAVARDAGEFIHDLVTLAELQVQLVKEDAQRGLGRMTRVSLLFVAAAIVAVSAVPVALLAIGHWIALSGLSLALSLTIATGIGFAIAAVIGLVGWKSLKSTKGIFDRSKKEFAENMQTLKHAMKKNRAESGATT